MFNAMQCSMQREHMRMFNAMRKYAHFHSQLCSSYVINYNCDVRTGMLGARTATMARRI